MRALRKGQAGNFYFGHPLGKMRLMSSFFEMEGKLVCISFAIQARCL